MNDHYKILTPEEIAAHPFLSKADEFGKVFQDMPIENQMFGSVKKMQEDSYRTATDVNKSIQEEKVRQQKWQEDILEAVNLSNNSIAADAEGFIIIELCNVITLFEQRVAEFENRGEVEISNDIYASIKRILETQGISSEREATIGRAKKELGETDFYFSRLLDEQREDISILESKVIENFSNQYKQLLGYLNPNFTFGITISINKKYHLDKAMQYIEGKLDGELYSLETEFGSFQITEISSRKRPPYYVTSKHILPELPEREMKIYHLLLNLYDAPRKDIAAQTRK